MNELIISPGSYRLVRHQLLAGTSALVLSFCVLSHGQALARTDDRPTVWIDLGGQMELMQGNSTPFTAPFMATTPDPGSYKQDMFLDDQHAPRHAFGLEGSVSIEPQDSDWSFSASIRYGRAHGNRHRHEQGEHPMGYIIGLGGATFPSPVPGAPFADVRAADDESHTILDFSAGRDIGVGLMGHDTKSTLNFGIRFAQLSENSDVGISARPHITSAHRNNAGIKVPLPSFYQYFLTGNSARSFRGIGPSLSWKTSTPLVGDSDRGELLLDLGINGAVLFGRQKARVSHATQEYHLTQNFCKRFRANGTCAAYASGYPEVYSTANETSRSHSIVVPNIGGFAGLSARYRGAKVSLGYRADFFFGAVDTGIDQHSTKNLGFNGPFATISIGLGG